MNDATKFAIISVVVMTILFVIIAAVLVSPSTQPATSRYSEAACIEKGGRITDFGDPPWMGIIHWICSVPPT